MRREDRPIVTLAINNRAASQWSNERLDRFVRYIEQDIDRPTAHVRAATDMLQRPKPSRLFSLLALQLMASLSSGQDWYSCSICSKLHRPKKWPRGNSYCSPECSQRGNTLRKSERRASGKKG